MSDNAGPTSIKDAINDQLRDYFPRPKCEYSQVAALIFYWKDADKTEYSEEAKRVQLFFDDIFGFDTKLCAIPSKKSQFFVDSKLKHFLEKYDSERSLLIVYYGGHGESDSGRDEYEQLKGKRSVWAASARGGATVKWHEIQSVLVDGPEVESDVLILLDCCHAAQAGRGRDSRNKERRCELLAACAMGLATPGPGRYSFTARMIEQINHMMKEPTPVLVSHLHGRLAKKGVTQQTPIYIDLRGKSEKKSIQLQSLRQVSSDRLPCLTDYSPEYFTLKVSVDSFSDSHGAILKWIKNDPPRVINCIEVDEVVLAKKLMAVVLDPSADGRPEYEDFSAAGKEDIQRSWDSLKQLLSSSTAGFVPTMTLRSLYTSLRSAISRSLVASPRYKNSEQVGELAQNENAQATGLSESLRVREGVMRIEQNSTRPDDLHTSSDNLGVPAPVNNNLLLATLPDGCKVILEYKVYIKEHREPCGKRVENLAKLLSLPKTSTFHTLNCKSWYEQPEECRFVLVFEYSPSSSGEPVSLLSLMNPKKKRDRPTLGERFKMAYELGLAVENWHTVGWVHQNISSPHIIIFPKSHLSKGTAPGSAGEPRNESFPSSVWDYSSPFLGGFEYARPLAAPSIPAVVDDFRRNVYRHPARQGEPTEHFRKKHDIYSFGVLLLEIGLWQSAASMFDPNTRDKLKPEFLRTTLLKNAMERLPHYMGVKYAASVCNCLNDEFGVDVDDELQSRLGAEFRRKVVDVMSEGLHLN